MNVSSNNNAQFLFVTVPTTDGKTAVFNAIDVTFIAPHDRGAAIYLRGRAAAAIITSLTPDKVAAETEATMTGLLTRMLGAAAREASKAGW